VAANAYHFITTWRIAATPEEISDVLGDAPGLARWWPSVYLDVRQVAPGDERGLGKVVELWTKGFLPYTLRWRFTVSASNPPTGFRIEAEGDFVGRGIWTLAADHAADAPGGPLTTVTYDWLIVAEKGVLKRLSLVMKPIFSANHHWAMRKGERSLALELARRHATDPTIVAALPAPPGPTFPHNLALVRRRGRLGRGGSTAA
jgi:polyketide cyclase/dehydrase/lipid transport protein